MPHLQTVKHLSPQPSNLQASIPSTLAESSTSPPKSLESKSPWDPSSATATTTTTHPQPQLHPHRRAAPSSRTGTARLMRCGLPARRSSQRRRTGHGCRHGALGVGMGAGAEGPCVSVPCICLRMGRSSWRGEGRLYEGGREGAGGRRGEGEECGGEESGRRKEREQEKWKKLQQGLPWVGFPLKKVLPPEKAILVSRSVRVAASLSPLPKKAILA